MVNLMVKELGTDSVIFFYNINALIWRSLHFHFSVICLKGLYRYALNIVLSQYSRD
jgi:hypothetical protein